MDNDNYSLYFFLETVELTLPPHSYVTVMAHDEPNEHSHTFHVTNNGEVPVIAEVSIDFVLDLNIQIFVIFTRHKCIFTTYKWLKPAYKTYICSYKAF